MNCLELFAGTQSFSKVARERGHKTFTVELNANQQSDWCVNILHLDIEELKDRLSKEGMEKLDVIWASPPCTAFSVASIYRYWHNGKPKTHKTYLGLALAKKTLEIIEALNPAYYFIENPRGMMRKQHFMQGMNRKTVTYCQYGANVQKLTDIWNNCVEWIPKKNCLPGDSCHDEVRRNGQGGVQGVLGVDGQTRAAVRAIIPPDLFNEIFDAIEGKAVTTQQVLNEVYT